MNLHRPTAGLAARRLVLALCAASALAGVACSADDGHGPESGAGYSLAMPERPVLPERNLRVVTTGPLSTREALEDPRNLLEPDPVPLHPPQAVPGGTLRVAREMPLPDRYNWVTENYMQVHEVHEYVAERVARRHSDDPSRWAPQLAERVTRSDDGRVYTVELRRGVRWHRPFRTRDVPDWLFDRAVDRELTAADFAFTFDMIKDPRVVRAAPLRSWYRDLERVEVVDRHTIRLHWRQAGMAAEMWTMWFAPIPRFIFGFDEDGHALDAPARALETHFYRFPIGTGPYRLAGESSGELVRLERNPEYRGIEPPIDAIELESLPPAAIASGLASGRIDVARLSPALYLDQVARARPDSAFGRGRFELAVVPALSYDYIAWNLREPLTRDVRVRQALTLAFDRERALDEVLFGLGEIRTGPYSSMTPYSDPAVTAWPFDLAQAARLLDAAGWRDEDGDGWRERLGSDGRPERLVLRLVGAGAQLAPMFEMYASDLLRIGVAVEWVLPEPDGSIGTAHGMYGSWGHDWEDDPFQVFHSSQSVPGGSNAGAWSNAEADELIERVRTEPDHEVRVGLHRALHRLLHDEQPYTFLFEHHTALAWGKRVRGVRFARTPPHDLSLSWWLEGAAEP